MHMPVFIYKYMRSIVFSDVYSKGSLDKLVLCLRSDEKRCGEKTRCFPATHFRLRRCLPMVEEQS